MREIEGHYDGRSLRIGIAMATFNAVITEDLLAGALAALEECSVADVTVVRLPGALELPLAARKLIAAGMDGVVAIGAVVEGETDHYVHVARETMGGLQRVTLETGVPVANAVLTVREFSHARDRSLPGKANKGYEAARAAVATVNAFRRLS
ncbi:MAG: 6,7-dimethyl-8-ribityllumazine synthase [Acidimicrobiia bacterium]|nr:6,7-dimethyl-8-ribityllumazine synthase [Acidimicrobiia bacterium]MDH3396204.1 6,7-dimethyl-8-ribityllumazine synthase [Acidimicrobiia bacterium]MDH5615221.1 6,7-dimethyl-8-ribityllumazine synthase [Acidimicrobiia bacterium]